MQLWSRPLLGAADLLQIVGSTHDFCQVPDVNELTPVARYTRAKSDQAEYGRLLEMQSVDLIFD